MTHRVVVTGLGTINPLGNDVATSWQNAIAGKSGVGRITHFDPSTHKVQIAAEVKGFDPAEHFGSRDARRLDRYSQLALVAARQAIADAGWQLDHMERDRVGVIIGSGIGGASTFARDVLVYEKRGPARVSPFLVPMMLADTAPGLVAIEFGLRGPNFAVVSACASGTNAVGEAFHVIRRGDADAMLVGGADAVIIPVAMAGLEVMTALSKRNDDPEHASRPFDAKRDGFVMGEGATFLALETLEHAQARGATILAEVVGYGSTNDAFHITAPDAEGAGAALCMQNALRSAGLEPQQISYINAHGTSTRLNDKSETAAIKAVFGDYAYRLPVSSTKSMTGHLLGGAGALEAMFSVLAIRDGIIPPTINYEFPDPECDLDYVPNEARRADLNFVLSNSFGFGGHNASIIFGKFSA